ncbi:MAG: iron-sulfur cluster assembly scaffold protein [Desulfobacterales bacterium]|nr:iron-sulfur cluster assembly scaffold protein [Desulfobacterales bacterium]MDD4073589.1 iron-sulfur cluster assembly scaffold protein [Desulfobacterales bacterium]MDD4393723.1 iron-sulfur cluster assembly scaffold protein [Desulfobacterales bacterium]
MEYDLVIDFKGTGRFRERLLRQGYSDRAIDYYLNKPYMGTLADADLSTELTGDCGDTMKITMKMDQGKIADVRFEVDGCPGSVSSAMALVDIIKGKTLDEAYLVKDSEVFFRLEAIPDEKVHCIQLAVKSLQNVIDQYRQNAEHSGS